MRLPAVGLALATVAFAATLGAQTPARPIEVSLFGGYLFGGTVYDFVGPGHGH